MTKAALKAPKFDTTPIKQALGGGATVPIGTGRQIGATMVAGREYIAGAEGFEQRNIGRAFVGRMFGR